jgi:plasmid stabilization system protein ParE
VNARIPTPEGYTLHPAVYDDIDEIAAYIAEETSVDAADRLINSVFDRIHALVPPELRHQGHRRPDLTDRPLRFVLLHKYLIAYAPDEEPMQVIAVLHGRRNPRVLSALLDERH